MEKVINKAATKAMRKIAILKKNYMKPHGKHWYLKKFINSIQSHLEHGSTFFPIDLIFFLLFPSWLHHLFCFHDEPVIWWTSQSAASKTTIQGLDKVQNRGLKGQQIKNRFQNLAIRQLKRSKPNSTADKPLISVQLIGNVKDLFYPNKHIRYIMLTKIL